MTPLVELLRKLETQETDGIHDYSLQLTDHEVRMLLQNLYIIFRYISAHPPSQDDETFVGRMVLEMLDNIMLPALQGTEGELN